MFTSRPLDTVLRGNLVAVAGDLLAAVIAAEPPARRPKRVWVRTTPPAPHLTQWHAEIVYGTTPYYEGWGETEYAAAAALFDQLVVANLAQAAPADGSP